MFGLTSILRRLSRGKRLVTGQDGSDIYLKPLTPGSILIADIPNSLNLRRFEEQTRGISSMTTQAERRAALYLSLACPVDGDIVEMLSVRRIVEFLKKKKLN